MVCSTSKRSSSKLMPSFVPIQNTDAFKHMVVGSSKKNYQAFRRWGTDWERLEIKNQGLDVSETTDLQVGDIGNRIYERRELGVLKATSLLHIPSSYTLLKGLVISKPAQAAAMSDHQNERRKVLCLERTCAWRPHIMLCYAMLCYATIR
jgi:hypothetical protein